MSRELPKGRRPFEDGSHFELDLPGAAGRHDGKAPLAGGLSRFR